MCNRQAEKTAFFCITVPLVGHLTALISTKLHKDLCQQPGTLRFSWAGGMWEGVIWRGSWGFACESQSAWATLWSLEVPLDLEGLKWHVMNDFAEPQIFMHELQLYESVSPLKTTSRSDGKRPSHSRHNELLLIRVVLLIPFNRYAEDVTFKGVYFPIWTQVAHQMIITTKSLDRHRIQHSTHR